jgi:hypothetical protein
MASVLIQTSDAVAAELNIPTGHTWSLQFIAERTYADFDLPLEDDAIRGKLLCDVVPVSRLITDLESRGGSVAYEPSIDIVFRKKFEPADAQEDDGRLTKAAVDELVALVEEVNEHFTPTALTTTDAATWKSTEIVAAVMHKHLREFNQFTGIIRLTFDATKGP